MRYQIRTAGVVAAVVLAVAAGLSALGAASAGGPDGGKTSIDPGKADIERQLPSGNGGAAAAPAGAVQPLGIFDNNFNLHKDTYFWFSGAQLRVFLDSNWVGYPAAFPPAEHSKMKDGSARVSWLGVNPYNAYWMRLDGRFTATGVSLSVWGIGVPSGGGSTGYTGPDRYNVWYEQHVFGTDFVHFYGLEIWRVTQAQTGWIRLYGNSSAYAFTVSDGDNS